MSSYNFDFKEFQDRNTLAKQLAQDVSTLLSTSISKHGRATLIVSGGTTPVLFFEELSQIEIEWPKVIIGLADERWVKATEAASNEALVKKHLLKNRARHASFIGLYTGARSPFEAEAECERRLLFMGPPFDVLVLGMGLDGHTASLFPGAKTLGMATDPSINKLCVAMNPPKAPYQRMTLTVSVLLQSENIFLHIEGEKKKVVFDQAIRPGAPEEMPIRFILLRAKTKVKVFWTP